MKKQKNLQQQQLKDDAKKISDLSNQLIDDTNNLLQEPENQQLVQKFQSTKGALQNEIKKAEDSLREERLDVFDPFADKEKGKKF